MSRNAPPVAPSQDDEADAEPTMGDVVEVLAVETVVRLDGTGERLGQLVLTGDVMNSLDAVLEASSGGTGAGFFVVGPFGSGKSHFLAAVGELLGNPTAAQAAPSWDERLVRLALTARPSRVVPVPLVEYRATASLEDVVWRRAWSALGLAPPAGADDRRAGWDSVLAAAVADATAAAAASAGATDGMVVLLDELSEFLRAKQGPALTEDLRFLQFLGEWASDRPVIVVAALQESLEEVANVSQRELTRIRDRYRPSLTLSMRHVEDLVRGRLVRIRPGRDGLVSEVGRALGAAFPGAGLTQERVGRCYPLHPDTLSVLQGLRFVLSQQRGVVDFVCRRVQGALDRRFTELVTADEVFDHFRGRLTERSETVRLADTVVPYFERATAELVGADDAGLAMRVVKLLCLLAASPLERPRSAAELAAMLLARASEVDAALNATYLERAILEPLVQRGAYVVAKPGSPVTYSVTVDADASLVVRARAAQRRAELSVNDRRLVDTVIQLGSSQQLPLQLLAEVGLSRRDLVWQNTLRTVLVGPARILELDAGDIADVEGQAAAAGAEVCLLVGELELDDLDARAAAERAAVIAQGHPRLQVWVPAPLRGDEREALLNLHSHTVLLGEVRKEGRADLEEALLRWAEPDAALAREILRRAYFEGAVAGADLPSLAGLPFERQLPRLVAPVLAALHPRHGEVAPRSELIGDRLVRQLLDEVIVAGRVGAAAAARGQLRALAEGYLVPLGLARVRNDGIVMAPDPHRSPLVAEVLRLVGEGVGSPVAAPQVVQALADGPFGLSQPEAVLVLNACVQSGLIEATRGRRRHIDAFLTISPTDRFGSGELVPAQVRALAVALSPITGLDSPEPWTAAHQRSAWERTTTWLEAKREELAEARAGLERLAEVPTLSGADPGPVLDDLATIGAVVDACSGSLPATEGLMRLADAVGDFARAESVAGAARRVASICRFLRDDLRRVEEAAAYLSHPDLVLPSSHQALRALHQAAIEHVRDSLALAAQDRGGQILAASREFRTAYLAAYEDGHDRYYGAVTAREVEQVRATPAYRALSRLSAIGALAVPDDRVKVDRLLVAAAPPRCNRPLNVELGWKPRCSCGYTLEDRPPELDPGALVAVASRGVGQYLQELSAPGTAARLADAAADLDALGRSELAEDLRRLTAIGGGDEEAGTIATLLGDDLVTVLRDLLSGGQLIVTRDLAALREDLIGRRYPKRKLAEIVTHWIDPAGELPSGGFIEIVDSADTAVAVTAPFPEPSAARRNRGADAGGTVVFLERRFPGVAALLPGQSAADAFWLAAWWAGRPVPPPWLPPRLLADRERLQAAAEAARWDLLALAELGDLDSRIGATSLLADQMAAALDLGSQTAGQVAEILRSERLFRHPVRLAADQLVRRLPADWGLASLVDPGRLGADHSLIAPGEVAGVAHLVEAAGALAALERAGHTTAAALVEDLYPARYAPVRALISRAEQAVGAASAAGVPLVEDATLAGFRAGAERALAAVDVAFEEHAQAGFPGCLRVWEIGDSVMTPLLERHGRVAVLLVDAMRADLALRVEERITAAHPTRPVNRRWAVVPAPTRTAESLAAMHLGRPVGEGEAETSGAGRGAPAPFDRLGYETKVVVGADRQPATDEAQRLWRDGPPLSVVVATGVDERLHRSAVELAALLDEAVAGLERRVIPALAAVPPSVPIVVLADHGFRENPHWGHGRDGRYTHGGVSPEECVVPVLTFGATR